MYTSDSHLPLLEDLLKNRLDTLNRLAEVMIHPSKRELRMKDEDNRMSLFIDEYILDDSQIADLESLVDAIHGHIIRDFRKDFKDLKSTYHRMFLYLVMGLPNFTIMALLHEKDNMAIYNKKKYLKKRIKLSTSPNKDRYLMFL